MNETTKVDKYLTFVLNHQQYGMPIASVIEINRVGEISRIPQTPSFVAGVMNLRGKVIPVINLRLKFSFEHVPYTKETCIIVVDGQAGQVGMIVDQVTGVIELAAAQIDTPPAMGEVDELHFILGLGKLDDRVVILIDAVQIVAKTDLAKAIDITASLAKIAA